MVKNNISKREKEIAKKISNHLISDIVVPKQLIKKYYKIKKDE